MGGSRRQAVSSAARCGDHGFSYQKTMFVRMPNTASLPIRLPGLFGLGTPPLGRKDLKVGLDGNEGNHILVGNLDETLA